MSYITDKHHLLKVAEDAIVAVEDLAKAWLSEDQSACAPGSSPEGPSSSGPSDPTPVIASRDHKFATRDRLGGTLLYITRRLREEADSIKPRMPTQVCRCCEEEMATHGTLCWACSRYRKKMDRPCDDEIHQGRGRIRMCECSSECCEVCPDRAAEGRSVSERCKKRMQRATA